MTCICNFPSYAKESCTSAMLPTRLTYNFPPNTEESCTQTAWKRLASKFSTRAQAGWAPGMPFVITNDARVVMGAPGRCTYPTTR